MKDFLSVALKDEQNVIWHAINDESDAWCEETESLGIVAAATIMIVVTYFTLGSCSGLVAPLTSAGVQGGLSAGAAVTMASGVAAGLSAGVCGELLKALDIGTAISGDIGQQVLSRTQEAAIRAGVIYVFDTDGGSFEKATTTLEELIEDYIFGCNAYKFGGHEWCKELKEHNIL